MKTYFKSFKAYSPSRIHSICNNPSNYELLRETYRPSSSKTHDLNSKIQQLKTLQGNQRISNNLRYTPRKRSLRTPKHSSTLVYTHLIPSDDDAERYHKATAKDEKEAGELIAQGWQYVCTTPQGIMMFRKPKKRGA